MTLPSTYQIGDVVLYLPYEMREDDHVIHIRATIVAVTFTKAKVFYDIVFELEGTEYLKQRVDSAFVLNDSTNVRVVH